MRLTKGGHDIRTVPEWREFAPPEYPDRQWQPGHSALELAAAWCGGGAPAVPPQLADLLESHEDTRGCTIVEGFPELPNREDPHRSRAARVVIVGGEARQGTLGA
ncbi:MAG: hypothetical protein IRZ00_20405 [Gemmatimonadetes bacterium]|nr:hypothetical protein [Gemmatimonadota bacterium]